MKSLSELIEASERWQIKRRGVPRTIEIYKGEDFIAAVESTTASVDLINKITQDYDRMKRVAVKLAVTLEIYQDKYQSEGPVDGHEYMEADVVLTELHAEFNTARAKDIIGEVK